jgi:hypothetical protein
MEYFNSEKNGKLKQKMGFLKIWILQYHFLRWILPPKQDNTYFDE